MAAPRRRIPPPFHTNEFVPVIVGTTLWAIAFVVLLTLHHDMVGRGRGWWLWVALIGFALGLWGLFMLTMHHRSLRKKTTGATGATGAADQAAGHSRSDGD